MSDPEFWEDQESEKIQEFWQKNLPGSSMIRKMQANHSRSVGIYWPKKIDFNQKIDLIIYFHGAPAKTTDLPLIAPGFIQNFERVLEIESRNAQFIWISPQAENGILQWMKPEKNGSFQALLEDAQKILKKFHSSVKIGKIFVSAHSAGGAALVNALEAGELQANHIDLFDSAYSNRALKTAQWADEQSPQIPTYGFISNGRGTRAAYEFAAQNSGIILQEAETSHSLVPQKWLGWKLLEE